MTSPEPGARSITFRITEADMTSAYRAWFRPYVLSRRILGAYLLLCILVAAIVAVFVASDGAFVMASTFFGSLLGGLAV